MSTPPTRPIAIMAAMPEELAAVMEDLVLAEVVRVAGRPFHVGTLHGQPVVVVISRIGKVAAATTATLLIERFAARAIVFVGLAGAIAPSVAVGDVVIAARATQHDLDVRPLFPRFEVPGHGVDAFEPPRAWLRHAEAAVARALTRVAAELGVPVARAHVGLLASGDQFMASAAAVAALRDALPDALAVEMEGAALGQVAVEAGIPWLALRTISDTADHGAGDDFPRFLATTVGPYARALVAEVLRDPPSA